ncbi:MAG: GNAT family N-acetyltransferase [Deltaproteobacteria bacterium]|nr:GNAT family N-acetyltransferase [Deltaproteobacteria bacterium]
MMSGSTLHELHDRERLRALYDREPLVAVRARSILYGLQLPDVRILVDDPDQPRGVLLTHDGLLWDAYSPDPQVARDMLDRFRPAGRVIFFGVAGSLLEHVRRHFEVIAEIPALLYVLADRSDFRPALPVGEPLGELAPDDATLVSDAWTVHDFESPAARTSYVRSCIERGPSAAVLHEGRPVSFVLTHGDGSFGILHTDPEFRRRGLGRRVLSALVEKLLRGGREVFAYVGSGNVASIALMEATGLRAVQETAVVTVGGRC